MFDVLTVHLIHMVDGGRKYFDEIKKGSLFAFFFAKHAEQSSFDLNSVGKILRLSDDIDEFVYKLFSNLLEFYFDSLIFQMQVSERYSLKYTV